ncbi:MAG: NUDIX hydrolase [Steroidobacteraceae bacterium]
MNQPLAFERPLTTVDLAILSVDERSLRVLLVQRPDTTDEPFPGRWALPGGFVDVRKDDDLWSCALRKLKEKTGVSAPYLEQVGSWGSAIRDPRGWSVTHLYFALLPEAEIALTPGGNAPDVRWSTVTGTRVKERLAFDHTELLEAAVLRLRNKVEYTSLPAFLMPHEFTLTELQRVYEIVLGRPLEKKAFRTRMLAADLLEELPRVRQGGTRPAQLFRLKHRRKPIFFARTFSPRERSE